MAQPPSSGHGIVGVYWIFINFRSLQEDVYKSVINDVINNIRETFLDENIDIDILQQLKKVCF
jgi:hypothetical protein